MNDTIKIRPLTTLAEMALVEQLQQNIWQTGDLEVIPVHTLHAIQFNGGALFGAFDGGDLVGFILGILGTIHSFDRVDQVAAARLKMYSVIAGVRADYQDKGVGYKLKVAQREFALNIGLRLVTWTYDPLDSRNGRFNISKLGGICHRYLRDFHGELGGLNAGLPTDRLEVEWWITSNRVEGRVVKARRPLTLAALQNGGAVLVNEADFKADGLPVPAAVPEAVQSNLILLEIPAEFQMIKKQDLALARRWRQHTRQQFELLFQMGYLVTDFVYDSKTTGRIRSFYLLALEEGRNQA